MRDNMKVSELWMKEMVDSLLLEYKDKPREQIEAIVLDVMKDCYTPLEMEARNIYKYENYVVNPDEILEMVYGKKNKILGVNGTLMDNHEENLALTIPIIDKLTAERKIFKGKMLKAKSENNADEEDAAERHSNNKKKMNNSLYGGQAMEGSIFASSDSAQLITSQAKNETSEMAWNMEKVLTHNLMFTSFNELILYIKSIIKIDDSNRENIQKYKKYITYYPTKEDLRKRYFEMIETAETKEVFDHNIIYRIIDNLTDDQKLLFYYKNNLITILDKNEKIIDFLEPIMKHQTEVDLDEVNELPRDHPLLNELLLISDIGKIPEPYKSITAEFIEIMNTFVTNIQSTHNRFEKYKVTKRKSIVITDTDSLILTAYPFVLFMINKYKERGIDLSSEYSQLKCTMFLCTYLTNIIQKACKHFANNLNVPDDVSSVIDFKNEFYFSIAVVYPIVKKNYIANNVVQEGNLIPKNRRISYTGIKAKSGELNPIIASRVKKEIIEEMIINANKIDPIAIYKKIHVLQKEIKDDIVNNKNKHYGKQIKFRGATYYGEDVGGQAKPRACVTWNRLYPEYEIKMSDTVYYYQTIINTLNDAERYIKDTKMLNKVKEEIFNIGGKYQGGYDFSKYGMKYLAIPKFALPKLMPEWIIDIIDFDQLFEKEFKLITNLLPGLNLNLSKGKGNRTILSPMLNF